MRLEKDVLQDVEIWRTGLGKGVLQDGWIRDDETGETCMFSFDVSCRSVSECGGKNFHLAHPSADMESVTNATIKAAFEYGGQKCSACSRLYVPQSAWPKVKAGLVERQAKLKLGSALEADTYLSAVINDEVGGLKILPSFAGILDILKIKFKISYKKV